MLNSTCVYVKRTKVSRVKQQHADTLGATRPSISNGSELLPLHKGRERRVFARQLIANRRSTRNVHWCPIGKTG